MKGISIHLQRALIAFGSITIGVLLIAFLIRVGKIDLRLTLYQLHHASHSAFVKLVLLNGFLVYISSEKWRSVDAALRNESDSVPSRTTSFAITSAGMALGLVIPVQLGMTTARTLGTFVYGRALKRGTAGTLLEQCFDILVVAFLAVSSGLTWFFKGDWLMWTVSAIAMTALALIVAEPSIKLARRLASSVANAPIRKTWMGNIKRSLSNLQDSGALSVALARRLVLLSTARFAIIALMASQVADAYATKGRINPDAVWNGGFLPSATERDIFAVAQPAAKK